MPPVSAPIPLLPSAIPGVSNYAQVSPFLHRGAQPTVEGFEELKRRGVVAIVDLRFLHDDNAFYRPMLEQTGPWHYLQLREPAWYPTWTPNADQIAKTLAAFRAVSNRPVFVHCQHGSDRTGCAVAAFRMVEEGWPPGPAFAEMQNFGTHVSYFIRLRQYIANVDAAATRNRVDQTPPPLMELVLPK
jgi:protein-tyrosine phosphatase